MKRTLKNDLKIAFVEYDKKYIIKIKRNTLFRN